MSPIRKFLRFAPLLALLLLAAGCGGLNVSKSVSPLDFLLPGAGSFLKANPAQPEFNQPIPTDKSVTRIA
jgi:hypothetical protein